MFEPQNSTLMWLFAGLSSDSPLLTIPYVQTSLGLRDVTGQLFAGIWAECGHVGWDVHMYVNEAPCSMEWSQSWEEKKG